MNLTIKLKVRKIGVVSWRSQVAAAKRPVLAIKK
jgi:hypothetical protein